MHRCITYQSRLVLLCTVGVQRMTDAFSTWHQQNKEKALLKAILKLELSKQSQKGKFSCWKFPLVTANNLILLSVTAHLKAWCTSWMEGNKRSTFIAQGRIFFLSFFFFFLKSLQTIPICPKLAALLWIHLPGISGHTTLINYIDTTWWISIPPPCLKKDIIGKTVNNAMPPHPLCKKTTNKQSCVNMMLLLSLRRIIWGC